MKLIDPKDRETVTRPHEANDRHSTQVYLEPMREFDDLKPRRPYRPLGGQRMHDSAPWGVGIAAALLAAQVFRALPVVAQEIGALIGMGLLGYYWGRKGR